MDVEGTYLLCTNCSSVQVANPTWLDRAHSKAISALDTGLVTRSISASNLVSTILFFEGKKQSTGLDWGGGTGLLARLLRDNGFVVQTYDKFAEAIHAEGFVIKKDELDTKLTFLTSIECFEHLVSPYDSYINSTSNKDYFFFTTETINNPPPDPASDFWWYFLPETGQHITFASKKGIKHFKDRLGFSYYFEFGSLHVMSRKKLKLTTRLFLRTRFLRILALTFIPKILQTRYSLTESDKSYLISCL